MPNPGAVLRHDRLGRVLCQVNSTRLIGLISAAAMETDAGEASDAARRYDHGLPRIVAEVADHVVGLLVFDMLDYVARARSRVRQEINGAVLHRNVVQGAPATQVWPVRVAYEPGVLVPAELQSLLGGLDDVLPVEEIGRLPQWRTHHPGYKLRDQELPYLLAAFVGMHEV